MVTLKKFSLNGQEVGSVEVDNAFFEAEVHGQLIKDYIVALRANARQWSANTKGRSEVRHSTKKPHPQKGGGRSRQGSLVAPQYRGGGRVFGPKPKFDQHVRINKKERQAAIRYLIGEKLREDKCIVLDSTELEAPKTQRITQFLTACQSSGKRILFLGEGSYAEIENGDEKKIVSVRCDKHNNFIKSMRNLPKTQFSLAKNISGYDVLIAHELIVTESALQELSQWLL